MSSITFTIDQVATGNASPPINITVVEVNGELVWTVTQDTSVYIADIQGIFFQVSDPTLIPKLAVTDVGGSGLKPGADPLPTQSAFGDDSIDDIGGVNVQGGGLTPYDVGVTFGTNGIGKDDLQTVTFTLGTTDGTPLTLDFIRDQDIAIRLTSVGTNDGNRNNDGGSSKLAGVICFYPGTRIATPAGEVAVETLAPGDLVLTADGRALPVRWVGRNTVSTRFGDPLDVLPIRIAAGALGENLPARDLLVSPSHALLLDGVLVQAGALVNGATITREAAVPEVFTYFHVEVAEHVLLVAEGAPAESFVDNLDREHFDNWAEYRAVVGEAAPIPEMDLPRAKSDRQVPRAIRTRLLARAAALVPAAAAAA